jgi:hypothetical protein
MRRLQLPRGQRIRYYLPVALCLYIALVCLALVVTAWFLPQRRVALGTMASGAGGLIMSIGLGSIMLWVQRRELRYDELSTSRCAEENYDRVLALAQTQGWLLSEQQRPLYLQAHSADTLLHAGELIEVRFEGRRVWVASICDPQVGFSLLGRRRSRAHRERVRRSVLAAPFPPA